MDSLLLKFRIEEKGHTMEEARKMLEISKSAWYRKRNGTSQFTQGEIQKFIDWLDLKDVEKIFFNTKVS